MVHGVRGGGAQRPARATFWRTGEGRSGSAVALGAVLSGVEDNQGEKGGGFDPNDQQPLPKSPQLELMWKALRLQETHTPSGTSLSESELLQEDWNWVSKDVSETQGPQKVRCGHPLLSSSCACLHTAFIAFSVHRCPTGHLNGVETVADDAGLSGTTSP